MNNGIRSYPRYKASGIEWLGEIPEHWPLVPLKWYLRVASGSFIAPITRGPLEGNEIVAIGGNGFMGYVSKSNVHQRTLAIGRVGVYCGNVHVVSSPAWITDNALVLSGIRGFNLSYLANMLRTANLNGLAEKSAQPLVTGTMVKGQAVPLPPEEEQNKIVRYIDAKTKKIDALIAWKQRLIELLNEKRAAIISHAVTKGLDPNVPMKDSGIEWLGEIPRHWEVVRGKDVCSAIVDCKNRTPMVVENGDFIVVRTSNVRSGKLDLSSPTLTDEANYLEWTRRGAPGERDVFFTREAPAGEACLVPKTDNLCMGQRMMYFRPDPELLLPEFLLASIYGPLVQGYVNVACNGSTVGHLRLGQVYAIPLLWCPLSEQKEIITTVNAQCHLIEEAASKLNRSIDFLREYRTALISAAVTGKIDVRNHAPESTESELEQIMEECG